MRNLPIREDIVEKLVRTGRWSEPTARLAERAGYKCEYCGQSFLDSAEAYERFQVDHIVPISKGGNPTDTENLALACRFCNCSLKRSWDPRPHAPEKPTRDQLIAAVKERIKLVRKKKEAILAEVRAIIARQ